MFVVDRQTTFNLILEAQERFQSMCIALCKALSAM
ncbi:Uncharacterised protein [BD1-7 clade bacterium]|uniref:Uncharacterized protein n=1 Tax=BD1-7 clade bacterium TaxID=2029982 RepID=A0A5S9P706_9GAMM|nr:Uncharacterised protein [BD1-7 clade bacterium]